MDKIYVPIPSKLDHNAAIAIARKLKDVPRSFNLKILLPNNLFVTPFGMILSCSTLNKYRLELINHEDFECSYAELMGWQSCLSGRKMTSSVKSGSTYMPIRHIAINTRNMEWRSFLIETTDELVRFVTSWAPATFMRKQKKSLRDWAHFAFRELLRNTPEHAETGDIWVSAQFWPQKDELEIAILDEGIGIFRSLQKNPTLQLTSCSDALKNCIQPGISSVPEDPTNTDEWGNSGYGLFVLSKFATETKGQFQIVSGDASLTLSNNDETTEESYHNGTAIRMSINPRKIVNFNDFMGKWVPEGEKLSRRRASRVTRIIR